MLALIVSNTNCSKVNEKTKTYTNANEPSYFPENKKEQEIKLPVPPIPSKQKKANDGIIPARIYIPTINVHAAIQPVNVSDNGRMGVPDSTEKVGYLSTGILPGATGNAVMDGHVDTYNGPAVFFDLKKLKKGDPVFIKNDKGRAIAFVVESVEVFKTSEAPIGRIFGPINESRLNLITCAGRYSRKKREHEARLVVFTKRLVNEPLTIGGIRK
ncbi:class F sortase [Cohnella cholangitidis]|uniref:Class F sortase n=1 Tax=Cohnella cholangitidis TaxID=2598458 RepID=A0A7G5C170_9BACL|nr:class F sortase [Cohnella cholangitidis]QMV42954.1 class F sortase [Cohnella cholangitidis]